MKKAPNIKNLKNILILRSEGSLGDAILSSCCYREYKKANQDVKISVACFGSATGYLEQNKYIDHVYRLPVRRVIRPNQRWLSLFIMALKLRFKNFDLIVDSSHKDFMNWKMFKRICGRGREFDKKTLPIYFFERPFHARELEGAIASTVIGAQVDSSYDLSFSDDVKNKIENYLKTSDIQEYVLLNPAGSVTARSFNESTLGKIVSYILENTGLKIVVPFMPAKKGGVEGVLNFFKNSGRVYGTETASVFELFALVKYSGLVITPDTAVVHIASGFKKRSIIFYNTYSEYNDAYNPLSKVIHTEREDVNNFNWADFEAAFKNINQGAEHE